MTYRFHFCSAFVISIMVLCLCSSATGQHPLLGAGDAMAHARAQLQKWSETEKMIQAERNEWEQGKALFEGRITLVQQSIEDLQKKIAEAEVKLVDARKRGAEVDAEKMQAKEASDELLVQAPELERSVQSLLVRVPNHVQEKVKVLADRIPDAKAEVKNITAAERFQNVLGILNELNKSNLEIASFPEIHEVGGGRKAEVKTIYVGLGQGYFVNTAGDLAGIGAPGAAGWAWRTDPTLGKPMLEVLEVMKKAVTPKLIQLPAAID